MAKTDFKSVDDYIAAQPEAARPVLEAARAAIERGVPDGEAVISYQICAWKTARGAALYLAGWKKHYSLYPATPGVLAAFGEALAPYAVEKGTIRFPLDKPVPADLIEAIARLRAGEVAAGKAR